MLNERTPSISPEEMNDAAQQRDRMFQLFDSKLAAMAHQMIRVNGLHRSQFVMACIKVDSQWRYIVDELMPNHDWDEYRMTGQEPVALATATYRLCEILSARIPSLRRHLMEVPEEHMVKVLVLDESGVTIYEIFPVPEGGFQ